MQRVMLILPESVSNVCALYMRLIKHVSMADAAGMCYAIALVVGDPPHDSNATARTKSILANNMT